MGTCVTVDVGDGSESGEGGEGVRRSQSCWAWDLQGICCHRRQGLREVARPLHPTRERERIHQTGFTVSVVHGE